jgi:hypothetical protein
VIAKVAALAVLFFALPFPAFSSAACIPFEQAQKHIGETQCVSGKVLRVEAGSGGVHYLGFCEDHGSCSFSVVVFASDLKRIGDVDQLAGKTVEIRGEVKEYDGRAEIVLDNAKQLGGEATRLPPFQKNFDVEQRGHFSAGQSRASKKRATTKKPAATLPIQVPEDAESD